MGSVKVRTQPVQGQFKQGPVLCMDIDGAAAPTGSTARFDVDNPHTHKGFITFDVGEFPLAVHPALPGWFTELEQAFAHCARVSDWGSACILFAQGAGLHLAARWPHLEAPMDLTAITPLTWHKLDGVRRGVHPEVPVAIVDDFMAPQTGRAAEADYIKQDIIRFAQRPGPTPAAGAGAGNWIDEIPRGPAVPVCPQPTRPGVCHAVRYHRCHPGCPHTLARTRCRTNWRSRYSSTRETDMKNI